MIATIDTTGSGAVWTSSHLSGFLSFAVSGQLCGLRGLHRRRGRLDPPPFECLCLIFREYGACNGPLIFHCYTHNLVHAVVELSCFLSLLHLFRADKVPQLLPEDECKHRVGTYPEIERRHSLRYMRLDVRPMVALAL